MPDSSDTTFDTSIPVLNEILVPGKPAHARSTHGAEAVPGEAVALAEPAVESAAEAATESATERVTEPAIEPAAEPATESATERAIERATEPAIESAAEPATESATEPVTESATEAAAEPAAEHVAGSAADFAAEPAAERVAESATDPAAERIAESASEPVAERIAESASEPAAERVAESATEFAADPPAQSDAEPADGVTIHAVTPAQVNAFALPEPLAPFELASAPELDVPPEPALVDPFEPSSAFHFSRAPAATAPAPNLDADALAERLRGRFASYLTGEGRAVIEARCRDALQDHTTWLINQITREVALTLETEMTGWVREAVNEEIARRSSGH